MTGDPSAIAPISVADMPGVLALNNLHAAELSLLNATRLEALVSAAFAARRVGSVDALLIAFDQDAAYDSPNFLWFRDRYPRFVYVDRIVVSVSARGRGLARQLYEGLFETARGAGHSIVTCEINLEPPNPGSESFHAALGFSEVGAAAIYGGTKPVRYYARKLTDG